ncbi:hypothetical protein [Aurantimonas marina]|uniref:hypothetical protein n=1 Tax=Aurantimonas marina TaxID=2780508 RepID=UPI0019D014FA|nr:hypothetical protein [Aurantimonas marina]
MPGFKITRNMKIPKDFSSVRELDDSQKKEMLSSMGVKDDAIALMLDIDAKVAKLKDMPDGGGPAEAWGAGCGGVNC